MVESYVPLDEWHLQRTTIQQEQLHVLVLMRTMHNILEVVASLV
jgi:hypothetical protein